MELFGIWNVLRAAKYPKGFERALRKQSCGLFLARIIVSYENTIYEPVFFSAKRHKNTYFHFRQYKNCV